MGLIAMVVLGAIAGWIASLVTQSSTGLLMDIILGIVGAVIGGFIMTFFGQPGITGFDFYSLVVAVIGALVLIWVGRLLTGSAGRVYR
ncbi:MAG: GlsB/YeaQ/YmgE family stress response membrane protein [Patescibacteria group bacterium]|nr:GlsB/YeaQ/YmgE family stress response membrane protein [Patescibacteria group bacterium]